MRRRPARSERGQTTVELAIVLPLIIIFLLFVVQVGLVVRAQLMVTHAVREGARAAAVGEDPTAAVVAASSLDPERLVVSRSGGDQAGELVTIAVEFVAPTDVPLVGAFVGDVTLSTTATMRVEG
ncbi:MAG: TadE family protein [Actinomycetota bacterium]